MRESKSTFRPGRRFRALLGVLSLLSGVLTYTVVAVSPAAAAGGSYALNFAAADPSIYLPPIPFPTDLTAPTGSGDGSVLIPLADFDDGTGSVFVESLAPQDMALGQIVPFFVEIDVNGAVAPENGEISFLVGWNTLTTNGGDFGYDARVDDIGYEVIGAFVDTSDGAHLDGGTAAAVSGFSSTVVNDELVGAFTVSGLDDGDRVVVEMWVVLDDTIPAGIGGNVQSRLIDAATGSDATYTVANSGAITLDNGDSISTGNQTVPLLKPSDFFNADVDLSVTKSDNPDPVDLDGTLTYTITVANAGPSVANSVVVYDELDPNTTFVSASDGGNVNTDPGDTIPDGAVQWDVGSLAPGESVQYTVTVTVNSDAPTDSPTGEDLLNSVTVTTISDDTDTSNNVDTEPTDVNAQQVVAPDITLIKTANPTSVEEPGGVVTFTVEITNDGDAGTIDSLVDDIHGDLAASCVDGAAVPLVGQTIDAGETLTCTFTAAVNGMGGDSETDTVTTVVSNDGGSDTASDTATVTITDVPSSILVTKTANPDNVPETGGSVTYTFVVENISSTDSVTIDSLGDSIYGDLNGQGDCAIGAVLAPGDTYTCSITENVSGQAGQVINNVLTVTGTDDDNQPVGGTDDADVTVTDVPAAIEIIKTADPTSVDEPGGSVTFSFTINNLSPTDSVTIDSLTDTVYGDLNGQGDCSVPQTIVAGGSYNCSFATTVSGNAGDTETNVVTASGLDDDGNLVADDDDATVTINDVPSAISVTKTANPTTVPESGGDVTYTFVVNNDSTVDSVTINSLSDSIYGDLNGQGDCSTPQTIAAGGSYTCSITVAVAGNAGDVITNVLTASGTDDDGNPVGDSDDADVTIDDVPSEIVVSKTANPTSVSEPGDNVTFTFTVDNASATDAVTINSLTDSIYGDLNGQGDCSVPQTIAAGGSYSCSLTALVAGNAGDQITNVLTVAGVDDDGNPVDGTDDAMVDIDDVPSSILVTKTASPTSVPETGGDVTYTVVIENTSAVDTVTINTLTDDRVANAADGCVAALPADIAPGETITCTYTAFVDGDTGSTHTNVATAMGEDDDGNPVMDHDDETITFDDVDASIEIIKTATPTSVDEPGGNVTFNFVINNTSPVDLVNITSLEDSIYGDLNGQGDCSVPQTLLVGESYSCSITEFVGGNAGAVETNVVTATGIDDDGETVTDDDDATVTIDDVPSSILVTKTANPTSVPESGGDVTFTVTVENTSAVDDVTITSVIDDQFGDVSASCAPALPATIAPGGTITCTFTEFISGNAGETHVNVVTASGTDDDGGPVEDDDQEEVPFDDVQPEISVVKTADPTSIPETGADVEFTFVVTNDATEDVTLDSLVDSDFGDLNGQGTCVTPQSLAANGGSYICSIVVTLSGDASGPDHENTVTATASDDDGNTVDTTDDETVVFEDVLPDVSITKTADPTSVPETGGNVEFTIVVTNNSLEDATIDSLVDSDFDLAMNCPDVVGTVLGSGDSYTCVFTETLSGDASGAAHENTATVVVSDGDGNTDSAADDATVGFDDVLPTITVSKTADPTSVPETGGDVEFTVVVTNTSDEAVTIDSLVDSDFDLAANCADAVGTVLAPGGTSTCVFTETLSGDASGAAHENTATAVASDNEGNPAEDSDDATVTFDDVLPDITVVKTADPTSVPETGADVVFSFVVTNNAAEDATLDSLVDSDFGDLNGQGTCAVPQPLPANGGDYTCQVTVFISGDFGGPSHENTVTATASDNEGNPAEDSDDAAVDFTDVLPDISITKTADPTSVDEPGGNVTFTLVITNNSLEEVNIDSLTDSDYNADLAASCPEATDVNLQFEQSYTCVFSAFVDGNAADGPHENTATVVGSDDDGNSDTASDDEAVVVNNVAPIIEVTKTPNQAEVFAPGENVTFTIRVENNSVSSDPITITSIVDDVFGDVSGECVLPQIVGAGGAFECDITRFISSDHTNTVTVTANDDEGNDVTDFDDASVEVTNPSLTIEKSTGPADADTPPGPEILVGETVNWFYQVTNDGDVELTDLMVTDDQGVTVSCPTSSLPAGATTVCEASGTATAGQYANIGTASASYTDPDGDTADRSNSDPSHYFGTAPSLSINKTFADDSTTAGGAGSSFELVVTNNGNVDLDNVSVFDDVDDRLTVTGVSGTAGADDDSDGDAQTVEWLIADLAIGDSVTITVDFTVDSSVGEADGPGGINDDPAVSNTATVTSVYTDDVGNSTTIDDVGSDTIGVVTSADLRVEKTDAFDPVLAGFPVTYTVTVFNDGPSDADNVVATDTLPAGVTLSSTSGCQEDPGGVPTCSLGTIAAGGSASYDVVVDVDAATTGSITNGVTVTSEDPDPDPDNNDAEEDTFIASPSVSITKTFADASVIAGGAGGSFELVATNDGNVPLSGVSISDVVDGRLTVTGVSGTAGADDDSDGDAQTVEWLIADLAVGESVTITVDFTVAADVEEADGIGGLNDADAVENTATVSNTYTDDAGNTADLSEQASDAIDIKVDIELSIDKTFINSEVPQGTIQTFTIEVSNAGPSDAVGVTVDDLVDDSIAVSGVTVTSGTGNCSTAQQVDCTVDIPAGQSVLITVDYVAAPFLDGSSGNLGGDDFRFVFVNGSVLEGSTATGDVFLDGVDVSGNVTIISSLTRNDVIFDPPGPDPAFELHLSCSDPFTGGWGQSGGPVEGVDTNWQIAYFSIARFNNNGFIKNCGNVTNPFEVPNTATATGEDSFGEESVSDTATLTIGPGITLDRLQTNGKRLTVRLTNFTGDDKIIDEISAVWPNSNGNLTKIRLDDPTVWQGNDDPPDALLDATDSGWNGGTLVTGEGILRFDFNKKSAKNGYTIRLNFTDGTFLDINQ